MAISGEGQLDPTSNAARRQLRESLNDALMGTRADTLDSLAETARIWSARPGDVIYHQGEPVPITMIIRGYGMARRTTLEGQQIASGVTRSSYLFGYSGIASSSSSVEIVALTECVVAQWAGPQFRELVAADSGLALAAIDSMAYSLHETLERIEGFLHQDARRRVLRILSRHRALFFEEEPVVLDRTHLPGLVGTSREMTSRVLRQLEQEGLLTRVGRTGLRLLRPDRLDGIPG
jgi:CRP-like cAMP-binding protein